MPDRLKQPFASDSFQLQSLGYNRAWILAVSVCDLLVALKRLLQRLIFVNASLDRDHETSHFCIFG